MENYVIILILAALITLGVVYTVKHFRREGGCCGGGSSKPRKKKLSDVLYQKKFRVDGMHCKHCSSKVEQTVNDIRGIAGKVNLKKGELTVFYAENVDDEYIISLIEKAGYTVLR